MSEKRYNPIGHCIYCGAYPGAEKLGDEHIIPYGLNGAMVLPKASCFTCAKITGTEVEQECLRKMLIDIRTHLQMKTRRPKDRPKTLRVGRFRSDKSFERWENVPVADHPLAMALPQLAFPTELTGKPHHERFELLGLNLYSHPDFLERLNRLGGGNGLVQYFHPEMFCRMLGKIAHSYAVAELGVDGFKPLLNEIVLGKNPFITRFVGGAPIQGGPTEELHTLRISRVRGFVDVYIRLFASYGAPTYLVIAGR